ncbi:hypothetical protein [Mesorhizobium sp. KR9-304]|uniref:hypothetical protein n=1 Tax=Mesorhizobium sp. KR9-304 TaxID=3156614 RepID=UPI0032B5C201
MYQAMGKERELLKPTRPRLILARGRYCRFLARSADEHALQAIWAVHAIQSGRVDSAKPFLKFPEDADVSTMDEPKAIYKWELETFITSLLTTAKDKPREGRHHITNLTKFDSLLELTRFLRDIEECEYALTSRPEDIFEEMYRIGQRQFSWQRGTNREQIFRYAYVYGQGDCAEYFRERNGLSVQDFMLMSLMICGLLFDQPWTRMPDLTKSEFSQDQLNKTLSILSIDVVQARSRAAELNREMTRRIGRPLRIAYMPSLMRRFPLFSRTDARETGYIAPLPPLVLARVTAGLYYDFMAGSQQMMEKANRRFEQYIRKLLVAYHGRVEAFSGDRYGPKGLKVNPPDCLVMDGNEIKIAIECKATKLTFEAQFAEDPLSSAKQGFEQMAKAVFQLWRFFSHARRGVYTDQSVSATAIGVVLTMDAWMQMAGKLRDAVMQRARGMAQENPDITDQDKRNVVFCSVQELNDVCAEVEFDGLMEVMNHALTAKYHGWSILEVMRDCGVKRTKKGFPMKAGDLVPWLDAIADPTNRPFM